MYSSQLISLYVRDVLCCVFDMVLQLSVLIDVDDCAFVGFIFMGRYLSRLSIYVFFVVIFCHIIR